MASEAPLVNRPWQFSFEEVWRQFGVKETGLTEGEILSRQRKYGLNLLSLKRVNVFSILWRQISGNPLILILATATFVSFLLGERISALYIFVMILVSVFLGLWNEFTAEKTVENLLKK